MEDVRGGARIRHGLQESNVFSLEVVLESFSADQVGPARIITYSRNPLAWNFTLGQDGEDLIFRLRTSENDAVAGCREFHVTDIFKNLRRRHLAITYNGQVMRFFADGIRLAENKQIQGDFRNWEKNHSLAIHDEITGERFWKGKIFRFSIYNRVLGENEISRASTGNPAGGYLYQYKPEDQNWKPLRYRNLFVTVDRVFDLSDCVANILAFIPISCLLFFALPAFLRRKQWLSWFVLPLTFGVSISLTFEFSQRFIAGRVPCLADLAYNVLGTLIGCILLMVCVRRYKVVLLKERKG